MAAMAVGDGGIVRISASSKESMAETLVACS